jgi:hypothetical protein
MILFRISPGPPGCKFLLVMNLLIPSFESCAKRAINAYDPRLSGVDENSQGGASFLESGPSLEDAIKPHASGPPHRR